jgi:4-hydroxybenzoate polyprenyltransferase
VTEGGAVEANRRASRPLLFARLIKLEHSVYALPFAYAGALLAEVALPSWQSLVWITVAMVAGRSAAMALNRLIDAELDARNPRTAGRELPAGRLRRGEVIAFTAVSLGVLVLAAFNLSEPCRYLWPIVVAAFVFYPYAKRLSWLCHYALGLTDGLAPAAAWIAVSGSLALAPVLLFFAVGLWVGGFDVIYGCFDVEFDRREGVHSIPARFGEPAALRVAAVSHIAAIALLVWVGVSLRLPTVYFAGIVAVGALLMWSSVDIARRGLGKVGMTFMTVNGLVGIVYLGVVLAAVLVS